MAKFSLLSGMFDLWGTLGSLCRMPELVEGVEAGDGGLKRNTEAMCDSTNVTQFQDASGSRAPYCLGAASGCQGKWASIPCDHRRRLQDLRLQSSSRPRPPRCRPRRRPFPPSTSAFSSLTMAGLFATSTSSGESERRASKGAFAAVIKLSS